MIHLDRNHPSPIVHHPKANLILADNNHADQHPILSWSTPARDDHSFYPDPQDQFVKDLSAKPAIQTENPANQTANAPANNNNKDVPSISSTSSTLGPITPGDAENPKLPGPSPSSPADAPSPIADSSSSLSPPPETVTPAPADADPVDGRAPEMTSEGVDEQPAAAQGESSAEIDRASRQSTPLSELSSAPDLDEESETKAAEEAARPSSKDGPSGEAPLHETDDPKESVAPAQAPAEVSSSKSAPSGEDAAPAPPSAPIYDVPALPSTDQLPAVPDGVHHSSHAAGLHALRNATSARDTSRPSSSQMSSSIRQPPQYSEVATSTPLDPKVVSILELNHLLLSVCMAYQSQGIPMSTEPRLQQYEPRLQRNLAWLAATADGQKGVELPFMQPPPVMEFGPMDRIQQIYAELPTIFAKEIARKQSIAASSGTLLPQLPPSNGKLKRDRPDEIPVDISNKRRDTGETKIPTPIIPPTPMIQTAQLHNLAPQPTSSSSLHQLQTSSSAAAMRSPSMPPPSVPSALVHSATEVQLAAARDQAQQMQLRQAMQQHQQQMQAESSRQMSPPQVPQQMQRVAGPSSMSGMSGLNPAALQALGPQAMQHLQILQNPNHPAVQYLIQQVPGFTSLPLQQQLQKLQMAQAAFQARNQQQQNQRAAAQQAGGASGYPPTGMPSFNPAAMSSGQLPQGGSPPRVSPVSQQSSMQGQPHLGGFPFTNHGPNPNQQMDMRTATAVAAASGFTPQQQAALAMMTPQQRQLFMMQQQQMQHTANVQNQRMMNSMNPQLMAAAQERLRQEQRMAQAGMTHLPGSPMVGGMDGTHFPALRSNPSVVPGIARSTRTPSDSAPSPVAPQRLSGQGQDDLQRAFLMQQRGMTPHLQNAGLQNAGLQNAGLQNAGGFQQLNSGMLNTGWPQNQQQAQMSHNPGSFGMSPGGANPGHGGGGFGMGGGGLPGRLPSPASTGLSHNWTQNAANGQYPYVAPSPSASQHHSDAGMTPRQASATPGPHMSQNSPGLDQSLSDFELFNSWGQ